MQKITSFLWFDDQAEEAVKFLYCDFQKLKSWNNSPLRRRRSHNLSQWPDGGIGVDD